MTLRYMTGESREDEERRNCQRCDNYRGYVCAEHRKPSYDELEQKLVTAENHERQTHERLLQELHEAGDGDTWEAACHRVEEELERTQTQLATAYAELERLQNALSADCTPQPCGHAEKWLAYRNAVDVRSERYCVFCELENSRTSEAELYDKCGELQKLVWKLEAEKAGGE